MALLDIGNAWQASDDTTLFKRFLGACLKAATDILNEAGGTANHSNRVVWAKAIKSLDDATVKTKVRQILRWGISTNAVLQSDPVGIVDNDIQFIVNSGIDTFATGS